MRNFTVALLLFLFAGNSHASIIVFQHSGNTDPTTEGWIFNPGGTVVGAITNDLGSGIDAWFVDDNTSVGGTSGGYSAFPTISQVTDANTLGWTLSANLRITDVPDTVGGSPGILYRDGTTGWQAHFGTEADGDPIVQLITGGLSGPSFTLQGSGGGYHLYELIFDPVAASVDLFVDGSEVISNYSGFSNGATQVTFGAFSSADTGQGNYNSVQFSIASVPVPSAVWLFGSGLVGLIGVARRKKAA